MNRKTLKLLLMLALIQLGSCDANFIGDGSGAGRFNTGGSSDDDPKNPYDPNDPNNPNNPNNSNYSDGDISIGNGIDTNIYLPATATVVRRDRSSDDQYDHTDVTFNYQIVGSSRKESGKLPAGEGSSTQIPRVCPPSGSVVKVQISMDISGTNFKPNKNNVGGIIGDRINETNSLLIAIEKEAVNDPKQSAYHANDDFVVELKCPNAKIEVANLCIDKSIVHHSPKRCGDGGHSHLCHISDLVTDYKSYGSSSSPARNCTGN